MKKFLIALSMLAMGIISSVSSSAQFMVQTSRVLLSSVTTVGRLVH